MHILKEAVCSSRIAGIPISIREFLFSELELDSQKKDYKKEVENYSAAIKQGVRRLRDPFLSNRLIKTVHKTLFNKVSGKDKKTGEFRSSQNWIGGASLKDVVFIPPIPNELDDLLVDFELFLNQKMETPHLIRVAIAHYQFETINPFLDGNGRIGRLLIALYLIAKKALTRHLLYISSYFEEYEELYYTKLSQVRKNNNLVEWIKFFLTGVFEVAKDSAHALSTSISLKHLKEKEITQTLGKRMEKGLELLNILFEEPIMSSKLIHQKIKLSVKACNDLIKAFTNIKILHEITGFQRNRIYKFQDYIEL